MRAAIIFQFGSPNAIVNSELDRPEVGDEQVLVRIAAAGVGPWDALIREGKSVLPQPLPLTLGSDYPHQKLSRPPISEVAGTPCP
jgi:NADPH:quinone reductase and related Zn-dependent oxidoreductases